MQKKLLIGGLIASLTMGVAVADSLREVTKELSNINVPAIQAVQAAEQLFQGQTFDVDLESNFMGTYWQIKMIAPDQRLIEAYVDGKTGQVVAAEETVQVKGKKQKTRTQYQNGQPVQ